MPQQTVVLLAIACTFACGAARPAAHARPLASTPMAVTPDEPAPPVAPTPSAVAPIASVRSAVGPSSVDATGATPVAPTRGCKSGGTESATFEPHFGSGECPKVR